jgi:hypothetical protein
VSHSLSTVLNVLNKVQGSGCDACFQTPDGKKWQIGQMVITHTYFDASAHIENLIQLEPVKENRK